MSRGPTIACIDMPEERARAVRAAAEGAGLSVVDAAHGADVAVIWAEGALEVAQLSARARSAAEAVVLVVGSGWSPSWAREAGVDAVVMASEMSAGGLGPGVARAIEHGQMRRRAMTAERVREFLFSRAEALAVVVDASGTVLDVSEGLARIVGLARGEMVGRPALGFLHEEDRAQAAAYIAADFRGEQTPDFEARVRREGGDERWVRFSQQWLPLEVGGAPAILYTGTDIDEAKHARSQLEAGERMLRRIAENSPVVLYVYDMIEDRNRWTGRSLDTVLGVPGAWEHAGEPGWVRERIHPEDYGAAVAKVRALAASGRDEIIATTMRVRRADGSFAILDVRETVLERTPAGEPWVVTGAAMDITERQEAERRAREAEEARIAAVELQVEVLDGLPASIAVLDQNGTILVVNDSWRTMAKSMTTSKGYTVGDNFLITCASSGVGDAMERAVREVLSGTRGHVHGVHRCPYSQPTRWYQVEITRLTTRATRGGVVMLLDVTARLEAEEALRRSEEQLRHAQKLEAVGVLASGVAHDFSNLLTAIRGYTGLARATLHPGHAALESLEHVEEAARQAVGVAGALLTFASKGKTTLAPVRPIEGVESAVRLFRRMIPAGVTLSVEAGEGVRGEAGWIMGDATQVQQVAMNLLLNARDAVGATGRIVVRVDAEAGAGAGWVALRVEDTGVGVPKELRERVFEPFFTTKPRGKGTGLGLSVLHGIVKAHEGTVELQSEPGRGSVFIVRFPRIEAPRSAEPAPGPVGTGGAIIVSANQLVRGVVSSMLTRLGYDAVQASTIAEAQERLSRGGASMKAVVIDEGAGGIGTDGASEASRVAKRMASSQRGLRAVVLSGRESDALAGVRVVRKPFGLADLAAALGDGGRSEGPTPPEGAMGVPEGGPEVARHG